MKPEIGNYIKARRLELGYTLQDVADYVGVTKSAVQKWENGHIEPMRGNSMAKLSTFLHIPIAILLGWMTPEEADQLVTTDRAKQAIKDVFVHYGILGENEEVTQELLDACMPAIKSMVDVLRKQK